MQASLPFPCRVQTRTTWVSTVQSVLRTRVTCSFRRQSCLKEKMKKHSIDLSRKLVWKTRMWQILWWSLMYSKLLPNESSCIPSQKVWFWMFMLTFFVFFVYRCHNALSSLTSICWEARGQNSCADLTHSSQGIGASTAPGIPFGSVVTQLPDNFCPLMLIRMLQNASDIPTL